MEQQTESFERRKSAVARLKSLKDEIISVWEAQARVEVVAARDKDSLTVQNELTHFLDALIRDHSPEFSAQIEQEKYFAVLHGQQGLGLTNYTLIRVLKEFALSATQNLKGQITECAFGKGARFYFTLPKLDANFN